MIIFLCLVTSVLAEQVYKSENTIDLKIPCTNNGTYCSEAGSCNATILSPNGTILFNNVLMSQNNSIHNISLNANQTVEIGDYEFIPCCKDMGESDCKTLTFKVTRSGKEVSEGESGIYIVLIIMFVILGIASVVGAWKINGQNEYDFGGKLLKVNFNKYVKIGLWLLAYLFLTFTLFYSWQLSELLTMTEMTPIFKSLFLTLEILFAPFFFLYLFFEACKKSGFICIVFSIIINFQKKLIKIT